MYIIPIWYAGKDLEAIMFYYGTEVALTDRDHKQNPKPSKKKRGGGGKPRGETSLPKMCVQAPVKEFVGMWAFAGTYSFTIESRR
jgi:hypothetical protein